MIKGDIKTVYLVYNSDDVIYRSTEDLCISCRSYFPFYLNVEVRNDANQLVYSFYSNILYRKEKWYNENRYYEEATSSEDVDEITKAVLGMDN